MNPEQRERTLPLKTHSLRWLLASALVTLGMIIGVTCAGTSEHAHQAKEQAKKIYTCPMHPQIRQHEPGACPICGMDLTETLAASNSADTDVKLSARAKKIARLRVMKVGSDAESGGGVNGQLSLNGKVDYDERGLKTVTTWIGGRIESLTIRSTGAKIGRGKVIAKIYSPEVYSAHQDLISASQQATAAPGPGTQAALQATRQRLLLLGLTEKDLKRMQAAKKPDGITLIRSPFSGTVIERVASDGVYVAPGSTLYKIANLNKLWVQLDAYAEDLSQLKVGQEVSLSTSNQEDPLVGTIAFIDPIASETTQTARVRVEVTQAAASEHGWRAGMNVTGIVDRAEITDDDKTLTIPASAVLYTGRESIVYVEKDGGQAFSYHARPVVLGPRHNDRYAIVSGLEVGKTIVVHAAFVLDADLQLRGGPSALNRAHDRPTKMDRAEPQASQPQASKPQASKPQASLAPDKKDKKKKRLSAARRSKVQKETKEAQPTEHNYYTCPMHPHIHEHVAGKCPICKMNLISKKGPKDDH